MQVEIRDASLRWQNHTVFEHLSLTLPSGSWTCILGQSGIGKSSLIQLLCGLTDEASEIHADIHTADGAPLAGRVAWMAQQDLLLPWLNVLDNVLLGPRLYQNRTIAAVQLEHARFLLHAVDLENYASQPVSSLSGGQRQRVALARTLMLEAPLVCMDEPFSALDAFTRLKLQDLAAELLKDRTVLMITHDPLEALRLADSIHVLSGSPARLGPAIQPAGTAPRAVDNPDILHWQGELLRQLK